MNTVLADEGQENPQGGLFKSKSKGGTQAPSSSTANSNASGYPADPDFQLRGSYDNPMVDAAMPLFGLIMRLRTLDQLPNIATVHAQVRNQITTILDEMRQHAYEPAHLLAYSYALCLYLDEAVMHCPWGRTSYWSHEPLLSVFHHETWGGEKFFTVLARMLQEPQRYKDVLEVMYLCLCLGFKGKYGIAPKGDEALQALIGRLYRVIRELRGPLPDRLCEPLGHVAPSNYRMNRQWPWWSPLAIGTALMAAAYSAYNYRLHQVTTEVLHSLNAVLLQ